MIKNNTPNEQVKIYNKNKQVDTSKDRIQAGQSQNYFSQLSQVPQNNRVIVVNQISPVLASGGGLNSPNSFFTICQFCNHQVMTITKASFNCGTCLICFCTGWLIYIIIQLSRGKDLFCRDVEHKCPNCGRVIGIYRSC